jgi:hypothetical protein
MAKVVTVRLSEEEYKKISRGAKIERRPISNFISMLVMKGMEEADYVDPIEMAQITSDRRLVAKLRAGHRDAKGRRGKLIG